MRKNLNVLDIDFDTHGTINTVSATVTAIREPTAAPATPAELLSRRAQHLTARHCSAATAAGAARSRAVKRVAAETGAIDPQDYLFDECLLHGV